MKTDAPLAIPLEPSIAVQRIQIAIGPKRYELTIFSCVAEMKREPAKV
jgi:hypothetical protein